ncbi:hypothetical protein B0H10DRAFT_1951959 [Mycena sp. CBHHK59/15]|nr:hypothetical protein B0H10DRAFT_1951959 [Mycena sp. CBHHK59/15]
MIATGTFDDFDTVAAAFVGVYGAWTNKDGFTVGEMKAIYFGMRIFEIAKQSLSMRHYVWSNLPYPTKDTGFNPEYKVGQMDGKATMGEWPQAQPFNDSLSWNQVTTGPYMDMLQGAMFGPLNQRKDGTFGCCVLSESQVRSRVSKHSQILVES